MKLKPLIAGLGLCVAPFSAWSISLDDCAGLPVMAHHAFEEGHQVVGQGVVSYRVKGGQCVEEVGCADAERLIISGCASGQTVSVLISMNRQSDGTTFDRSAEAQGLLNALVATSDEYAIEKLAEVFGEQAFSVRASVMTKQNCACAASFPGLGHGKEKFEGL